MAKSSPKPCELNADGCLTLLGVLESFNAPINEEQAWAICYQCAKCIQKQLQSDPSHCYLVTETIHVKIHKDGSVHASTTTVDKDRTLASSEAQIVYNLACVVYWALDYCMPEEQNRILTPCLESLIDLMTSSGSQSADDRHDADEGIERDSGEDEVEDGSNNKNKTVRTLAKVIQLCAAHLSNPSQADAHYKAVCRAFVAEALELSTFLDKIRSGTHTFEHLSREVDASHSELNNLHVNDWARLWVQVIKELRQGVQLKKVEIDSNPRPSIEYELTPYEILMDDIRSKRYKLNKIMVNGDIPPRVKKDAHALILEFIRSRPPLTPALRRELPPRKFEFSLHDQLMRSIREEHRLTPAFGRTVETSRTKLNDSDLTPKPTRRLIKVDPSCSLLPNSFDDEDDDLDIPLSPTEPAINVYSSMLNGNSLMVNGNRLANDHQEDSNNIECSKSVWRKTVALDIATKSPLPTSLSRRHSIGICESAISKFRAHTRIDPQSHQTLPRSRRANRWSVKRLFGNNREAGVCQSASRVSWPQKNLDCLSLTLEEVVHIRSVLTKAEIESLPTDTSCYEDVAKGKVCFTCRKTRFSFFGSWGQKCKLCKRTICDKCCCKMRIPAENFASIPVYTLSPTASATASEENSPQSSWRMPDTFELFFNTPASAPTSPLTPPKESNKRSSKTPPEGPESLPLPRRATMLLRSHTMRQRGQCADLDQDSERQRKEKIRGAQMTVCTDCKAMVCHSIMAGRSCTSTLKKCARVATAFNMKMQKTNEMETSIPVDCNLVARTRPQHLPVSPVYVNNGANVESDN